MSATTIQPRPLACTLSRAARELSLKRREFDLAVYLGRIRTVPDEGGGGGRRVEYAEIDRLRSQKDFPEALRDSVRAVGTTEGAKTMDVAVNRFTRLARLGLLVPVTFYLNRYRAVVWLYPATEIEQFAADEKHALLLSGRMPEVLRSQLGTGLDLRARNWRGRQLGFLLRQAEDPWERAGAVAAFLDSAHLADVVPDPYERSRLDGFRPTRPVHGVPGSPSAHLAEKIMMADDPDEIGRLRHELARRVEEARVHRGAPRPAPRHVPQAAGPSTRAAHQETSPHPARTSVAHCDAPDSRPPARHRGILGRLRRRSFRHPRA